MRKKKLLSIIIISLCCIAMAVVAVLATAQADSNGDAEGTPGLAFELSPDKESYICTGIGNAATTDIVIPATYKGKPVTMIGNGAFYNCVTLTSVTVQQGVQGVSEYAFYGCVRLQTVQLPGSIRYIGGRAFKMCKSLTAVHMADDDTVFEKPEEDVRVIDESAFKGCTSLTSLRFPEEITLISRRVLDGCSALTEITLPVGVQAIGEAALAGCTALTKIHYEGTVEEWNALPKDMLWSLDVGECTVICSDGTVTID